jgi:hypothetical protein
MMRIRLSGILGCAASMLMVALPLAAAAASKTEAPRSVWPAETLSGRVMMVDPAQHLLIMKGPAGVPFDITITNSTQIRANGQKATLGSLNSDANRNVTVRFVPERGGDIARTVRIAG